MSSQWATGGKDKDVFTHWERCAGLRPVRVLRGLAPRQGLHQGRDCVAAQFWSRAAHRGGSFGTLDQTVYFPGFVGGGRKRRTLRNHKLKNGGGDCWSSRLHGDVSCSAVLGTVFSILSRVSQISTKLSIVNKLEVNSVHSIQKGRNAQNTSAAIGRVL